MNPHQIVEAVLFASDAPLTADEIARADESLDEDEVEQAIQFLTAEYDDSQRSFEIVAIGEGYQILTRPEFAPYLERFDNVPRPSRLSGPALETLAIIAYRQPIGRVEIEYIRGVGSSGVIRTLQDRQLIEVVGRAEGLGRPLLYGTTRHFLEHFGFSSLEDLPRPEQLPVVLRERTPLEPLEEEEEEQEEAGAGSADTEEVAPDAAAQGGAGEEVAQGGEEEDAAAEGAAGGDAPMGEEGAVPDASREDGLSPGG
ncbi:MAG: SMC-Scp complex subunit ScpB [Gemmatimonadota bacterium]